MFQLILRTIENSSPQLYNQLFFIVLFAIIINSALAPSYQDMSGGQLNDIKILSTACNNFIIPLYKVYDHYIFIFYYYVVLVLKCWHVIQLIKSENTIFHFTLLNILFMVAKVLPVENTITNCESELKTAASALGTDRSRVPASYATKSYLDA